MPVRSRSKGSQSPRLESFQFPAAPPYTSFLQPLHAPVPCSLSMHQSPAAPPCTRMLHFPGRKASSLVLRLGCFLHKMLTMCHLMSTVNEIGRWVWPLRTGWRFRSKSPTLLPSAMPRSGRGKLLMENQEMKGAMRTDWRLPQKPRMEEKIGFRSTPHLLLPP